jgi:hypothetical protein
VWSVSGEVERVGPRSLLRCHLGPELHAVPNQKKRSVKCPKRKMVNVRIQHLQRKQITIRKPIKPCPVHSIRVHQPFEHRAREHRRRRRHIRRCRSRSVVKSRINIFRQMRRTKVNRADVLPKNTRQKFTERGDGMDGRNTSTHTKEAKSARGGSAPEALW